MSVKTRFTQSEVCDEVHTCGFDAGCRHRGHPQLEMIAFSVGTNFSRGMNLRESHRVLFELH